LFIVATGSCIPFKFESGAGFVLVVIVGVREDCKMACLHLNFRFWFIRSKGLKSSLQGFLEPTLFQCKLFLVVFVLILNFLLDFVSHIDFANFLEELQFAELFLCAIVFHVFKSLYVSFCFFELLLVVLFLLVELVLVLLVLGINLIQRFADRVKRLELVRIYFTRRARHLGCKEFIDFVDKF